MTESWYAPQRTRAPGSRPVIGIASTIKVLANAFGDRNLVSLIDGIENNSDANGKSIYFDEPNHAEWWIAFEAAFIRLIINVADEFPDFEVRIRPHPTERAADYAALKRGRPNVRVSQGGDIADWLEDVDVLLSFISTSQIDAAVRGKSVISLKKLFPEWVMAGLPERLRLAIDDMFPAPASFVELRTVLSGPRFESEVANEYIKKIFNFPSEKRPSELIANYISQYLAEHGGKPMAGVPLPTSRIRRLFGFPAGDTVLMVALDLKSWFGRDAAGVSHSYCAHRWGRNSRIAELAARLLKLNADRAAGAQNA
jgi:hypothetical protein